MRDGERFFAKGRDDANYELLQKQMRRASDWRVGLRRQVLARLAGLGRDARWVQLAPRYNYFNIGGAPNVVEERVDLFDTGLGTGSGRDRHTLYAFTSTALHTISAVRDASANLTYTVFDRVDGHRTRQVEIPIPGNGVDVDNLELTYMAARD